MANILDTNRNNIDVFSVQLRRRYPPLTDVRFSVYASPYQDPVKLNGRVLMYREEVSTTHCVFGSYSVRGLRK